MNSLWKLALVVVLGAGLAYAQGTYGSSQSQTQSTPPTSDQTSPSQQQPSSSTSSQTSTSSSGMAATDAQGRIQQALQQDSSLSGVTATTQNNKIELSGTVASKADKDKAKSIAESNANGMKVVDHIKVSSSSTSPSSNPPQR